LQESQELIVKCQQQERKVSSWNRQTDTSSDDTPPSDVPPSPLLLYRSSSVLVFKPAPFKHRSGEKVRFIQTNLGRKHFHVGLIAGCKQTLFLGKYVLGK